jgi:hypothetical protein
MKLLHVGCSLEQMKLPRSEHHEFQQIPGTLSAVPALCHGKGTNGSDCFLVQNI